MSKRGEYYDDAKKSEFILNWWRKNQNKQKHILHTFYYSKAMRQQQNKMLKEKKNRFNREKSQNDNRHRASNVKR